MWSSMGKISHLKCNFQGFPGKKAGYFFPVKPFSFVVIGECLTKCPYSKKTPLP